MFDVEGRPPHFWGVPLPEKGGGEVAGARGQTAGSRDLTASFVLEAPRWLEQVDD